MENLTEEQIREELESYENGNISQFKDFLKNCSKKDLVNAISIYGINHGYEFKVALDKFYYYLNEAT